MLKCEARKIPREKQLSGICLKVNGDMKKPRGRPPKRVERRGRPPGPRGGPNSCQKPRDGSDTPPKPRGRPAKRELSSDQDYDKNHRNGSNGSDGSPPSSPFKRYKNSSSKSPSPHPPTPPGKRRLKPLLNSPSSQQPKAKRTRFSLKNGTSERGKHNKLHLVNR